MQQKIVMSVHISSEKRRTQALKIAAATTGTYVRMNISSTKYQVYMFLGMDC